MSVSDKVDELTWCIDIFEDALSKENDVLIPAREAVSLLREYRAKLEAEAKAEPVAWHTQFEAPCGSPKSWTQRVVGVTNLDNLFAVSCFLSEDGGVGCWQRPHSMAIGESIQFWAYFPDINSPKQSPAIDDVALQADFEKWFDLVETGDGDFPPPKNHSDPRWDEYASRHAVALGAWQEAWQQARAKLAHAPQPASDEPCGGCGEKNRNNRCIGCTHDFCGACNGSCTTKCRLDEDSPKLAQPQPASVPDEAAMIDFLRDQRWGLTITYRGQWMCIKENMSDCGEAFDDPREAIKSAMLKGAK